MPTFFFFYLSSGAKLPQKRELWLWGQGLDMAVFLSCSNQFIKMVLNTKNAFLFSKTWINLYSTHSLIHSYFVLILPLYVLQNFLQFGIHLLLLQLCGSIVYTDWWASQSQGQSLIHPAPFNAWYIAHSMKVVLHEF